tara:strand:- start:495 stop:884 length:390 start_codon:yes stop_codon:yes gene_type:complete
MNKIYIETSVGELIDKITILEIKKEKILDKSSLSEINKEYSVLKKSLEKNVKIDENLKDLWEQLKNTNTKLWDIENGKRLSEKNKTFDEEFIKLARNVYKFNDERARIKSKINNHCGSNIKEIKQHPKY